MNVENNGVDWRLAELLLALVAGWLATRYAQQYWRNRGDLSSLVMTVANALFAAIYLFAPVLRYVAGPGAFGLGLAAVTAIGLYLAERARRRPPASLAAGIHGHNDDRRAD